MSFLFNKMLEMIGQSVITACIDDKEIPVIDDSSGSLSSSPSKLPVSPCMESSTVSTSPVLQRTTKVSRCVRFCPTTPIPLESGRDYSFGGGMSLIQCCLEEMVYHCGTQVDKNGGILINASDVIGCINAIKCADERFLSLFNPILILQKFNSKLPTNKMMGEMKELLHEEVQAIDQHHTTDLDDDATPSIPIEHMDSSDSLSLTNINITMSDLQMSRPIEYEAHHLIEDVRTWLSSKRGMDKDHSNNYSCEESVTSQCHLAIIVLYLLWTNNAVEITSIRLFRVGNLPPLKKLNKRKKFSNRDMKSSHVYGPNAVAASKTASHDAVGQNQLATGRFRISYTTNGKQITVDLAYLSNQDMVILQRTDYVECYIRLSSYIKNTLLDAYYGHEITVVDTCREDCGWLCYYNFRPLTIAKLPFLLLQQASRFNTGNVTHRKQQTTPINQTMKAMDSVTNTAIVMVRCYKDRSYQLLCDATTQYLPKYN